MGSPRVRAIAVFGLLIACPVFAAEPTPTSSPTPGPTAAPPTGPQLALHDAYLMALKGSEDVLLSEDAIEQARILHAADWQALSPTITATDLTIYQSKDLLQPAYENHASGVYSQTLLQHGFHAQRRATAGAIDAAQSDSDRARQQLMFDCVNDFVGVLRARQQVTIAQGDLARANAQVEAATARVKGGSALKTSLLLSNIDARRAQINLVTAQRDQKNAEAAFDRRFGIQAPASLVLPAPPPVPPMAIALDRAVSHRPDLLALQKRTLSAQAALTAAKQKIAWPTFGVQLSADYFDLDASHKDAYLIYGRDPEEGRAEAILSWPLFAAGAEYTASHQRKVDLDTAQLTERKLRRDITQQVKQAVDDLDAAQNAASLAAAQIKDAQENYDLVQNQFRLGAGTPLEVANAQAELSQAETLNLVAGYDQQLAIYALLFATGQLQL